MFGPLGIPEVIFILVLALLVFGPKRLPEIGRTVGKAMGEFRRASNELKRTINTEISLDDNEPRPAVARRPNVEAEGGPAPARPQPAIGAIATAAPGAVAQVPGAAEVAAEVVAAEAAAIEGAEVKAAETPAEAPGESPTGAPPGAAEPPAEPVAEAATEASPAPAAADTDPAPAATPDHLVGAEPVDTPVPEVKPES